MNSDGMIDKLLQPEMYEHEFKETEVEEKQADVNPLLFKTNLAPLPQTTFHPRMSVSSQQQPKDK